MSTCAPNQPLAIEDLGTLSRIEVTTTVITNFI